MASNADLQLSLGYLTSQLHLPENDNTLNSVIGSGDGAGLPQDLNRGWFLIPAEIYAERNRQGIGRFTGGLTANWRPLGWLTTRATFGYDVTNRQDTQFWPTGQVSEVAYPTRIPGRAQRHPGADLADLGRPVQRGDVQGLVRLERPDGGRRTILP